MKVFFRQYFCSVQNDIDIMQSQNFSKSFLVSQSQEQVFNSINDVKGWWCDNFEGASTKLGDEFSVRFEDIHYTKHKLVEVTPNQKIAWLVTDSNLSFLKDKEEWTGTKNVFDISKQGNKTLVQFTHIGLTPEIECFNDCFAGWTYYINSLERFITKGEGQPFTKEASNTTSAIATRFYDLAKVEKWFEIQDELFADDIKSIDPENSPYFSYAEGKAAVRKKGEDWVKRVKAVHKATTTEPIVAADHFAVGREFDITVEGHGKVNVNQIMLYEVKYGKIISEQFFYTV